MSTNSVEHKIFFDKSFAEFIKNPNVNDRLDLMNALIKVVKDRTGVTNQDLALSFDKYGSFFSNINNRLKDGTLKKFSLIDQSIHYIKSICQIEEAILLKQAFAEIRNLVLPSEYDQNFNIDIDWDLVEAKKRKKTIKPNKFEHKKTANTINTDCSLIKYEVVNNLTKKSILVNMPPEIKMFINQISTALNVDISIKEEIQVELNFDEFYRKSPHGNAD